MQSLIQKPAPDFKANAVKSNGEFTEITLSNFKNKKYIVLFFYPLNFTFVCPSEILAFSHRINDFKKRNVEILGISTDSHFSHLAWRNTNINDGGIGNIEFTLISDITKEISQSYGVLIQNSIALRGTFLIDKSGIIRHTTLNDLPLGRNVDETLRLVDALQFNEKHGEVCPAGWKKGEIAIKPTAQGISDYLKKYGKKL